MRVFNSLDHRLLSGVSACVTKIGFDLANKRFFGKKLSSEGVGCVGFTSHNGAAPLHVNVVIGVRFDKVERIYEQLTKQLKHSQFIGNALSELAPTISTNLLSLSPADMYGNTQNRVDMLIINEHNVDYLVRCVCQTLSLYGLKFLEENSSIETAVSGMHPRRDGAATIATKLPIMQFVLGKRADALNTMETALSWGIPLGKYSEFCYRLTSFFEDV